VTKLAPAGNALVFSTFLGALGSDTGEAIAVDGAGYVYVAGETYSSAFPTTLGAADTTHNDLADGFLTKLLPDGSGLVYSTFVGGASVDTASGLALDLTGNAYLAGTTSSNDFPTTLGAYDTTPNGGADIFVAKVNAQARAAGRASSAAAMTKGMQSRSLRPGTSTFRATVPRPPSDNDRSV
jgi:hypothetical protein